MRAPELTNLFATIDYQFDSYLNHLKKRQNREFDLSWLLKDSNRIFYPDYITFNSIGSSKMKSRLNTYLSRLAPVLWNLYVTPKVLYPIVDAIKDRYIPKILKPESRAVIHQLSLDLHGFLTDKIEFNLRSLRMSTYSDFFMFMFNTFTAIQTHFDAPDPYRHDKDEQNSRCLAIIHQLSEDLDGHDQKDLIMLYLLARSNWIDSVEKNALDFLDQLEFECSHLPEHMDDIDYYVNKSHFNPDIFLKKLKKKRHILYESDNAGEIVFDLFYIQCLLDKGHHITLCAKRRPVMNDITLEEVLVLIDAPVFSGLKTHYLNQSFSIIAHNSNITGKYPETISQEYKDAYAQHDFVVLKGQGNFHTLPQSCLVNQTPIHYRYKKPHIHIMGIKAQLIHICLKTHHNFTNYPPIQECYLNGNHSVGNR